MSRSGPSTRARLDAWREQRADRLDPVRFHFIDALEKRASRQQGEVRRLLDDRLSSLVQAYARDLAQATARTEQPGDAAMPCTRERGALGELVERLTRDAALRQARSAPGDAAPEAATFEAPPMLDEFQQIWAQVRTQSQLRQSMKQAPTDAGPLNSSALVHRSIELMRELSPGYLQQFLSYVDDLAWVEQLGAGGKVAAREAPAPTGTRKRSRSKASSP
jgi:hypothetical protein